MPAVRATVYAIEELDCIIMPATAFFTLNMHSPPFGVDFPLTAAADPLGGAAVRHAAAVCADANGSQHFSLGAASSEFGLPSPLVWASKPRPMCGH